MYRETADSQEVGRSLRSLQPAFLVLCDNGLNESGRIYGLEARIQDRSNSSVHPGAELLRAVAPIKFVRIGCWWITRRYHTVDQGSASQSQRLNLSASLDSWEIILSSPHSGTSVNDSSSAGATSLGLRSRAKEAWRALYAHPTEYTSAFLSDIATKYPELEARYIDEPVSTVRDTLNELLTPSIE